MRYAIGIDLGGTFIKYAVLSEQGDFVCNGKLPSEANQSPQAVTAQLIRAVQICQEYAQTAGLSLSGVGIGTPGIVDAAQRTVLGGAENIQGWENISLADEIEAATSLSTRVNNDANLMGLGETRYGAAQGCSDVVFLTIGTGIGGAVIIGGKLFGGYANRGTEIGHIPLIADGETCACGSVGCLEHYASAAALVRRFTERCEKAHLSYSQIDGELIMSLAKQEDPLAVETLREHCSWLGRGIAGLINIFSPQKIVLGGGLSEAGEYYISRVRQEAFRHAIPACSVNTEIVQACLGNRAGSLGAAGLIFE